MAQAYSWTIDPDWVEDGPQVEVVCLAARGDVCGGVRHRRGGGGDVLWNCGMFRGFPSAVEDGLEALSRQDGFGHPEPRWRDNTRRREDIVDLAAIGLRATLRDRLGLDWEVVPLAVKDGRILVSLQYRFGLDYCD